MRFMQVVFTESQLFLFALHFSNLSLSLFFVDGDFLFLLAVVLTEEVPADVWIHAGLAWAYKLASGMSMSGLARWCARTWSLVSCVRFSLAGVLNHTISKDIFCFDCFKVQTGSNPSISNACSTWLSCPNPEKFGASIFLGKFKIWDSSHHRCATRMAAIYNEETFSINKWQLFSKQ